MLCRTENQKYVAKGTISSEPPVGMKSNTAASIAHLTNSTKKNKLPRNNLIQPRFKTPEIISERPKVFNSGLCNKLKYESKGLQNMTFKK